MNINELKLICIQDRIPIIRDHTLEMIINLINKEQLTSIFEIGTAYGYSALSFANVKQIQKIISIEKNTDNYLKAKQYIGNNPKITLINGNCFEYEPQQQFDLIFIDGPKSKQDELFIKYTKYLSQKGYIVIDNIFLKKYSDKDFESLTKNQKSLVKKVQAFHDWLVNNKEWNINIIDIDDGIAICSRRINE